MRRAGWYPGKQVPELLALWKANDMLSQFEMFPSAERVLREFGGLRVDEHGPCETCAREPFEVDPTLAGYEEELFHHFSTLVNTRLYPLGDVDNGHNYWAIGEDDRVYLLMNDIQLLGSNIDEALENLITGRSAKEISPADRRRSKSDS